MVSTSTTCLHTYDTIIGYSWQALPGRSGRQWAAEKKQKRGTASTACCFHQPFPDYRGKLLCVQMFAKQNSPLFNCPHGLVRASNMSAWGAGCWRSGCFGNTGFNALNAYSVYKIILCTNNRACASTQGRWKKSMYHTATLSSRVCFRYVAIPTQLDTCCTLARLLARNPSCTFCVWTFCGDRDDVIKNLFCTLPCISSPKHFLFGTHYFRIR
jgi:hypothetical protein